MIEKWCGHSFNGQQLTIRNCNIGGCPKQFCEVCKAHHYEAAHLPDTAGISSQIVPYNQQPQQLFNTIMDLQIKISRIGNALTDGVTIRLEAIKAEVMALIPTRKQLIAMLRTPVYMIDKEALDEMDKADDAIKELADEDGAKESRKARFTREEETK